MTDWTTARVTPETLAELRRLLDEAKRRLSSPRRAGKTYAMEALRNAAVNALPALLDAAAERDALRAELAHMREARDNARAEVERLTAKLDAIEADGDKLSIMFGWLVYDVGEHTCGGYGPESGYVHEPGCGFEPVLRLDKLQGWPEVERLTALAEAARKYAAARQANIDHGPLLSARKAAHDALLAAMARLDEPQP